MKTSKPTSKKKTGLQDVVIHLGGQFCLNGRDGKIRTYDPLYPKQVRYQAALRPGPSASIIGICSACPYSIGKKMSAA